MVGAPHFTGEMFAGAAGHGAASISAADAKGGLEHGRNHDDAFRLVEQVLRNVVGNFQNFIEHHAAILQPVCLLIGGNGSDG